MYKTWGALNADRSNAMVVCHALTGNASLDTWWGDMLGPQKAFDTSKYFVVRDVMGDVDPGATTMVDQRFAPISLAPATAPAGRLQSTPTLATATAEPSPTCVSKPDLNRSSI